MSKIITSNDCPVDAGGWYHDLEAKYGYFVSFSGLSLRTKTSQSMSKCLNSWKVHRQTPDMGSREIRGLNGEGFWRRTLFYFQRLCRLCILTIFSLSSHYLLTIFSLSSHYLLTFSCEGSCDATELPSKCRARASSTGASASAQSKNAWRSIPFDQIQSNSYHLYIYIIYFYIFLNLLLS